MGTFVKEISDSDFGLVENSKVPVVVDFGASWCAPCRMIEPILEEVAKEKNGEVVILKVNVDNCPNMTQKFGIRSVPTIILFKSGEEVKKKIGAFSKDGLLEFIFE